MILLCIVHGTRIRIVGKYIAIRTLVSWALAFSTTLYTLSWDVQVDVVVFAQLFRFDSVAYIICHVASDYGHCEF